MSYGCLIAVGERVVFVYVVLECVVRTLWLT